MSESTVRTQQGRPKDPEKRAAIMEAARKLFLDQGYERTSVEAIAAEAGVSKLTVYSHFEDKAGLFKSLIACKCEEYFGGRNFGPFAEEGPEAALQRVGRAFMGLMFNPDVLALHRLLMASAPYDTEMTRHFYDTGPRPTVQALADLLAHFSRQGQLDIHDAWRAADHFLSMLRGDIHLRALLNMETAPPAGQVQDHINDCVSLFLRAYGTGHTGRS